MTAIDKTTLVADVSALADGQTADASDPKTPIQDLQGFVRAGRLGATDGATHVGSLDDILKVTAPVVKTINNPAGNADITLSVDEMVGTDGVSPGSSGIVKAPLAADVGKFWGADGEWGGLPGSGTVTSIDVTPPSGILTASGGPITSAGSVALAAASKSANLVAAGPASGAAAAWDFRALVPGDLPQLPMDVLIPLSTEGSSLAQIDLGSIGTPFSANYNTLLVHLLLRSDRASATDNIDIEINGDTAAANYHSAMFWHNGTTQGYVNTVAGTQAALDVGFCVGDSAPSNHFASVWMWIFNYASTSVMKNIYVVTTGRAATTNLYVGHMAGTWLNSGSAVEYLSISPAVGSNWLTGCQSAVYGIGA